MGERWGRHAVEWGIIWNHRKWSGVVGWCRVCSVDPKMCVN